MSRVSRKGPAFLLVTKAAISPMVRRMGHHGTIKPEACQGRVRRLWALGSPARKTRPVLGHGEEIVEASKATVPSPRRLIVTWGCLIVSISNAAARFPGMIDTARQVVRLLPYIAIVPARARVGSVVIPTARKTSWSSIEMDTVWPRNPS